MAAQKIDGTAIAKRIRVRINADIKAKQHTNPRYKPSLVIIQGIHKLSVLNGVLF
jgi:methylenetetrahydrofolate dehydrogenase (NADP+)/methenyltetrahydrofolate cyclohydrolase/formyltetrahydrofolate synthetase